MKTIDGELVEDAPARLVGEEVFLELEDRRRWYCIVHGPLWFDEALVPQFSGSLSDLALLFAKTTKP